MSSRLASLGLLACLLALPAAAGLQFEPVAQGLNAAVFLTSAPNDAGRLYIVEQPGRIRVINHGVPQAQPFLDITALTNFDFQELGLLGMAFDPAFLQNGHFYVYYTRTVEEQIQSVIARYTVAGDPLLAVNANPASAQIKLVFDQPYDNHNGGMLAFGPDGYLYVGTGDGGLAFDPNNFSQNLESLLGKLLRINVSGEGPATSPPDNPFAGATPGSDEIWAYGLRNPWRFSFDRQTNDLWIADVGQQLTEEVNFQPAGAPGGRNYGWHSFEGDTCIYPQECDAIQDSITRPIYTYNHDGEGKAIVGGYVYRGLAIPWLRGQYFFADYVNNALFVLRYVPGGNPQIEVRDITRLLNPQGSFCCITSFGEDADGELYVVAYDKVYRMVDDGQTYLDLELWAYIDEDPVMVTGPPGDAGRLCVVSRFGRVLLLNYGELQPQPFLDISDRVASDRELGLLGMAFHPDFAVNGHFYLNYSHRSGASNEIITSRISRFTVIGDPSVALSADPASEVILLEYNQPIGDHNGGSIAFSPVDGYLYVPTGDGGCCNDPFQQAQNLDSLLGKILRIDVNATSPPLNYGIPQTNPFVGIGGARPEIWAYGLRNPFRSSFDRLTGDLYIGDVGQDSIEEVDFQPAASTGGENYGWPIFEGPRCNTDVTTQAACDAASASVVPPVAHYFRNIGFSVTGGSVYRGSRIPAIEGRYFYSDYVTGRVQSFIQQNGVAVNPVEWTQDLDPEGNRLTGIVAVSEDGVGELFVVSIYGTIYKIVQGFGPDPAPAEGEGEGEGEGETEPPAFEITLTPQRDATLYEDLEGDVANGAGSFLFAGRTGDNAGFGIRRALLQFDLSSALLPGTQVSGATLRLNCSKVPVGAFPVTFSLHRVLADWGEGASNAGGAGGAGAPALNTDATWLHRFYSATLWNTAGGDFDAAIRASAQLSGIGPYLFSGDELAADVQQWLNQPQTNHGWMLRGEESNTKTARRFDAREHPTPANRPSLTIRYCGVPAAGWIFNPANGHYYLLAPPAAWHDARALAACAGGYLATINDAAENQWLTENLLADDAAWIGFNDETAEGNFVWDNGESAAYANWDDGEPNDMGEEDFAQILPGSGRWNDLDGGALLPGIIERDTPPIASEGEGEGEGEGQNEGTNEGVGEAEGLPEGAQLEHPHSADRNGNGRIGLSELLRVIQFYNSGAFSCADPPQSTEDGYLPGLGDETCVPHTSDYNPQDWRISLSELLRLIQFYNSGGYTYCPAADPPTEDGYCPGPPP